MSTLLGGSLADKNICPGCQMNVTHAPDNSFVRFLVTPDTKFECNCHRCDIPTHRMEKAFEWTRREVYEEVEPHEEFIYGIFRVLVRIVGILCLPIGFLAMLIYPRAGFTNRVSKNVVKIPTCVECKNQIKIVASDPNFNEMIVAVCVDFAKRHH